MRKAVERCRDCGTEYDIPSINYGNTGSERCPNCGSERSVYVGQSKNDDADLAGMYLERYFPIYSTWYTNEDGMYVEVPVYGGDGDNATTVHVSWEQIRNDERPYFRYDGEYDSSKRKSVRKYYDDPFNEEQCHEFPSIADEQYNDTSDEFCTNCGEEDCKLTMMEEGYWLCDDCLEELGYGKKSVHKSFNDMVRMKRMRKSEGADADTILSWVHQLAQSQGSYGRLFNQLQNDPEALQNLVDQGFKDPLDMILYLEDTLLGEMV